jgi:hypothetical protein
VGDDVQMKMRRHHNNKGYQQIKNGNVIKQLKNICKKLKLPFYSSTYKKQNDKIT